MNYNATYSPEDNKLRLYASSRLDAELYTRVKACGFSFAPKQDLFVAPMWTPSREDLLLELAGEIDDEDTSLVDRAEQRAERFDDYSDKRGQDAESARRSVSAIADNIPFGQPILVGHHSERHARKDAERIENGMRKAVKMWETSEYWKSRAKGAIRAAKYKERPDVRARRIKKLQAELRKVEKNKAENESALKMWRACLDESKWKAKEDGTKPTILERAQMVANRFYFYIEANHASNSYWTAYDVLRPEGERYKACPEYTPERVIEKAEELYPRWMAEKDRWVNHYTNRIAYEKAMLAETGGTVTDKTGPEVGGAILSIWAPRGGWAYIKKVNKVTVSILHQWNEGGRVFTHNEPLDKIRDIMTKAQVDEARAAGRIQEASEGRGFWLMQSREQFDNDEAKRDEVKPQEASKDEPQTADFQAIKEALKTGVQVVVAPQLFPTPRHIAEKMAELADIQAGHRVLEPSAGTGMLLGALGGKMFTEPCDTPYKERGQVHAIEINRALAGRLQAEFPLTEVHCNDFLENAPDDFAPFDRIIMNPPFSNADDIKHILHARKFLKPDGFIVAICANGSRQNATLRPLADTWEELPADTFKEQGTGVRTVLMTLGATQ